MINVVLLLLKWVFLGLLYIFLIISLFIIYKDLKQKGTAPAAESEEEAESYPRLVVLESPGEKTGETFLIRGEAVLGRTSECDVIISDVSVSHKHARISKSGRGFMLEDLGSTNGTLLNNRKIDRLIPVKSGDTIKIGKTTFEFFE